MSKSPSWIVALLGLLALGTVGLFVGRGARAEDAPPAKPSAGTWVFDVRVVRVDPANPTVLEVAPTWEPAGAAGATTAAAWPELLAGLKARGRTTILLDQRVTTVGGVPTEFKQERKRAVLMLQDRTAGTLDGSANCERRSVSFLPTGANGELVPTPDGLQYRVEVQWEEHLSGGEAPTMASASWKGSHASLTAGGTLVLSHREQIAEKDASVGLEIYVFVTGWRVAAK